ncbi:hypothetical protein C8A01DRAFT_31721 [Parachaetomium inaequale]|uniref:Cytochrome b5 heme-binding domain-containing protein n=1 Tax=Parachaetomium inaequale TaxID=2588326 RepID=A0AAN6SVU3_9PEZI|nr:hypothetical protein C8A01DRAFT_31721 [Parachaetomium inaequale]
MSRQAPSIASQLGEPQRSPWFRKYGGESRNVLNNPNDPLAHSGLAPLFPPLHPTYYAEDSTAFNHLYPYPMPSDYELDMLFGTEQSQISRNGGLTTWEMGVLREHLVNSWPGGHRQLDPVMPHILEDGYRVMVDESAWHPVFAKSKWYDFRLPIIDGKITRGPLPGIKDSDVWSVDVPRLWHELSVSLELANRWLRHMANGPWLNHVVHETWVEWMEAEPTAADLDTPGKLGPSGKPWRIPAQSRNYDSAKTLKAFAERLAPKLVWTFVDDGYHLSATADNGDLFGRTIRHWNDGEEPTESTPLADRQAPFLTIYIHVQYLRVLLDPKSTLAERCHATWSMAMTMLHELMHAINFTRHLDAIDAPAEPCYGQEWDRELGCSGIKSFFGSDIWEAPSIETTGKSGYKYGMSLTEFPSVLTFDPIASVNNTPVMHLGKVTTASPLPAAWSSSTLLEAFYTTIAQRYGLAAFQAPRLFSSPQIFRGFYTEALPAQPIPQNVAPQHAHLFQELQTTLTALASRRQTWARLRPWYVPAHARWSLTPYANVRARAILTRFTAAAHPAARLTDAAALGAEREANAAASGMYYWLRQHAPRPADWQSLDRDWVYAVLALMMQAVLPAREGTGYEHESREVQNTWFPSKEAAAVQGGVKWRFPEKRRVWTELRHVYELPKRHMEGKMLRDDAGGGDRYVSNRLWLLEQALEVKQRWERIVPMPEVLARELERELASLFQQEGFEKVDEEWLDWGFQMPAYSGNLATRDDQGAYIPWNGFPGLGQVQANVAQVAGQDRRGSRARGGWRPTKYFTVSEVGERISDNPTEANWALLPDDQGGYDVFNISMVLRDHPEFDVESVYEPTEFGRVIVSRDLVEALRVSGRKPLGKLLTWKHPQEVSEHDGQDGRELWCTVGDLVYNITAFRYESDAEKEALVALATKKRSPSKALEGLDVSDLLSRLAPYKCGYLRQATGAAPSRHRTFTLRELGRYIHPQIGMYCAIGGDVYDLGRYLHSHPGGAQILHDYAGRDVTDEFRDTHSDWARTLENHGGLRVGRMVDEISQISHMEEDEVVLLNRVFTFSSLFVDNEELYRALKPYAGTDATQALKADYPPDALVQLLRRDDLVCAKLVSATRRPITVAELRKRNRIPSAAERREMPRAGDTDWRVWVSVAEEGGSKKQMVYDVTSMIMFRGSELERKLRPWLGKEVRDAELAHMLRTRHESFIIGELHVGKDESRAGKAAARKAQIVNDRHGYSSQSLAGSKRRVGALDDSDLGIMGSRPKRFGGWR